MYHNVELFMEPRCILDKTNERYCEMSEKEHGFLCGLLKKYQPQKVVEVGIAGGGTTAVIMNCLKEISPLAQMHSVDKSVECYRKKGKKSGYQLEEVKEYLDNYHNHNFYLGKILPDFIEEIGGGIDFCILDTTHAMPGEVLDFLTILPYLKDGSVVVLHDVGLNLSGRNANAFATKILLDSVYGHKYYNYKDDIHNIAAFIVDESTRKYIANVFSALSITWAYVPQEEELISYRKCFEKHFDEECVELYMLFLKKNVERRERDLMALQQEKDAKAKKRSEISEKHLALFKLTSKWLKLSSKNKTIASYLLERKYNRIVVYGASYLGECLITELQNSKIEIAYVLDRKIKGVVCGKQVYTPDCELQNADAIIVTPVTFFEEIYQDLSTRTSMPIISLQTIIENMELQL